MNSNRILNLPAPQTESEPLRVADADALVGTTITINNTYDPSILTTATPAGGDLIGFADISDSNATRKATLDVLVAKGVETTMTTATANITTANITGGTATALTVTTLTSPTANVTNLDAGASGTAGTVDVFPATASKGKLTIAPADNTGNTTTTITNAAQADTRTYTIPDAGASANFIMSKAASFESMFKIPLNGTVAAAGSVIGDATQLSTGFTIVTGANGTVGVKLPLTTGGDVVIIKGTTAGVLKVWPGVAGVTINALTVSTAMSLASGAIPAIFISTSATQWYTIPLLPS
jgi:hypothetical protein